MGIYPVKRDVHVFSILEDNPPLLKESGLAFIPLYNLATKHASQCQLHLAQPFSQEDALQSERSGINSPCPYDVVVSHESMNCIGG